MEYIFVGMGGVLGALARYLVSLWLKGAAGFPYQTLAANLVGCFLLSFITFSIPALWNLNNHWRLAITTGFLGSFTTFSTFSIEMVNMAQTGNYLALGVYALVSLLGGLALATLGMYAALQLQKKPAEGK